MLMAAEEDRSKKLAHEVRTTNISSDFDLAGYGGDACDAFCATAFSKPLPLKDMVRFSFTVGGGKKVRQKYNDGLPMLLVESLKKIGFAEDRGASLDKSCAGLFKYQHNTDTDLKVTRPLGPFAAPCVSRSRARTLGGSRPPPVSPHRLRPDPPDVLAGRPRLPSHRPRGRGGRRGRRQPGGAERGRAAGVLGAAHLPEDGGDEDALPRAAQEGARGPQGIQGLVSASALGRGE